MSKTQSFGTGKRESHDSSPFYDRSIYTDYLPLEIKAAQAGITLPSDVGIVQDKIFCKSAEDMGEIRVNSIDLVFTSPPYNDGKEYDQDLTLDQYTAMIYNVAKEIYAVLRVGGRCVINVANLGRKPYIPLTYKYYEIFSGLLPFYPMGEIIWVKGKGANGDCAWGSWMSAKAPRLRDLHEYLLVFSKGAFSRPDTGVSDIGREEFMSSTLSVWNIPPASAKRIGHPAPFPLELAERVIRLFSYVGDTVLDPFMGSGTTLIAAKMNNRHYVGYDIIPEYVELAQRRLDEGDS